MVLRSKRGTRAWKWQPTTTGEGLRLQLECTCFQLTTFRWPLGVCVCDSVHAADVTQSVHSLLVSGGLATRLAPLQVLSLLIASAAHDAGEA
jgi:hypothetical protein